MSKKNLTIGFDLKIPRQKRAYETLQTEKAEKGMPHNLVIHEALELYALKLQGRIDILPDTIVIQNTEPVEKRKVKKTSATVNPVPEDATVSPSYELAEDELEDPYLIEQLNSLYSDEQ